MMPLRLIPRVSLRFGMAAIGLVFLVACGGGGTAMPG